MTEKNKYWVALIVLMWMSATLRVLGHSEPTKWALLVAGSNGYENYRHQADVCHAYQILKKGGLKDENIIVFMYDDIALHPENPRRGVIINHPNGSDVYHGVPRVHIYTYSILTFPYFNNILSLKKSHFLNIFMKFV